MADFNGVVSRMVDHLQDLDNVIENVERAKNQAEGFLKSDLGFVLIDLNHLRKVLYTTEGLVEDLRQEFQPGPKLG